MTSTNRLLGYGVTSEADTISDPGNRQVGSSAPAQRGVEFEFPQGVGRYVAKIGRGRILFVAHTEREDRLRIISARRATRQEQEQYEEGIDEAAQ